MKGVDKLILLSNIKNCARLRIVEADGTHTE